MLSKDFVRPIEVTQSCIDDMVLHRFLVGLYAIVGGVGPDLSGVEMVGQGLENVRKAVRIKCLHGATHQGVELHSTPQKHCLIDDDLGKHMLEHVLDLRNDPQLLDEILGDQASE